MGRGPTPKRRPKAARSWVKRRPQLSRILLGSIQAKGREIGQILCKLFSTSHAASNVPILSMSSSGRDAICIVILGRGMRQS